jgi:hypothetical protein
MILIDPRTSNNSCVSDAGRSWPAVGTGCRPAERAGSCSKRFLAGRKPRAYCEAGGSGVPATIAAVLPPDCIVTATAKSKPNDPIYAVCPGCFAVRECVLTEPCRMCQPPRYARVRFGTYDQARAYADQQIARVSQRKVLRIA